MSWAAAIGVAVGRLPGAEVRSEPAQQTCEGCGAALRPQVMVCDHCQRPRRGAEKTPGYPQREYDAYARHRASVPPPAPAPSYFTPPPVPAWEPSPPPPPVYEPPAPAPAPSFSSGGGGDFGGGASGGW